MAKCDTCRFLVEPDNPEHVKNYSVCSAPVDLPVNLFFWGRDVIEGKTLGAERWITKRVITDMKDMLKDCKLHEAKS